MYQVSEKCITKCCEREAFRPTVYLDGGGLPTIGYGRRCRKDEPPTTKEAELSFVRGRMATICKWMDDRVPGLFPWQVDALALFFYNAGTAGFLNTQTGQLLLARSPDFITWLRRWTHDAKGVVEGGLVKDRDFEAQLFIFGWGS